ncbi:AAA family ATPase, partial [Pseudomonas aeruginosa]|nr:AAA family ATPase [Pseudomonas aeruginosa]
GIKPGATLPEMADQIAEELAASGRPLIIDEMDNLVASGQVELIRDLYESSQASILLIGEEWLPTKLKKYERFHGRILSWIPAQPVSMDDARELVKIYSSSVVIA